MDDLNYTKIKEFDEWMNKIIKNKYYMNHKRMTNAYYELLKQ